MSREEVNKKPVFVDGLGWAKAVYSEPVYMVESLPSTIRLEVVDPKKEFLQEGKD